MKMHWDGRKCFLRFIRGTTQLDRHDAYPLCAGARTCFLDNGRTRLSLPAPHVPPASLRKSALRGDLPSGSLDRAHTLPGSLSKACPAPSPSLRIPIHYSRIFPFLQGGFANFPRRHQRLCLWTPAGLCLAPAKGLRPSRHPFAIELSFLSYCFRVFMRGFRLCGGDQRALRSPSGLLRCPPEITIWLCLLLQLVRKKYTNQITSTTNQVTWVTTEGFQRATGKPFGRRRSGDSPATIKIQ